MNFFIIVNLIVPDHTHFYRHNVELDESCLFSLKSVCYEKPLTIKVAAIIQAIMINLWEGPLT